MRYWAPGMGLKQFVKKYLSVIAAIGMVIVALGVVGGYTTFAVLTGQESGVNETLSSDNLADCVETLNDCNNNFQVCTDGKIVSDDLYDKCKADLDELSVLANDLDGKLSGFQQSNNDLQKKVDEYSVLVNEYKSQISQLGKDLADSDAASANLQTNINSLTANLTTLQSQFTALQASIDNVVANAAKGVCCVQKVYNPALKYYYLLDSRIYCTADASGQLGTKEFSCP